MSRIDKARLEEIDEMVKRTHGSGNVGMVLNIATVHDMLNDIRDLHRLEEQFDARPDYIYD